MPLIKSPSKKAVGKNIKKEMEAGKPQKQAVAIALNTQREAKKSRGGHIEPSEHMAYSGRKMSKGGKASEHVENLPHKPNLPHAECMAHGDMAGSHAPHPDCEAHYADGGQAGDSPVSTALGSIRKAFSNSSQPSSSGSSDSSSGSSTQWAPRPSASGSPDAESNVGKGMKSIRDAFKARGGIIENNPGKPRPLSKSKYSDGGLAENNPEKAYPISRSMYAKGGMMEDDPEEYYALSKDLYAEGGESEDYPGRSNSIAEAILDKQRRKERMMAEGGEIDYDDYGPSRENESRDSGHYLDNGEIPDDEESYRDDHYLDMSPLPASKDHQLELHEEDMPEHSDEEDDDMISKVMKRMSKRSMR